METEPIIIADGGKAGKKKRTRRKKAESMLLRALKDYSEFSLRVEERPAMRVDGNPTDGEMVIVACVIYCPKESLKDFQLLNTGHR